MVQADAHFAVLVALVAEGVLDLGHIARGGAGEGVGAHCDRDIALAVNLVVVEDNLIPTLAVVDGEATISV